MSKLSVNGKSLIIINILLVCMLDKLKIEILYPFSYMTVKNAPQ